MLSLFMTKASCKPAFRSSLVFCAVLLTVALSSTAAEQKFSGFLGADENYARLQKVELRSGQRAKRWLSPSLNFANYQKIMIDSVQLYPEPQPGPQVSEQVLQEIRSHLTQRLRSKLGGVLNVTDKPGASVLRIEAAVTGVLIKTEGMKAYEIVPVAAIFGAAKAASGARDQDVNVFLEVRMVDSTSGELRGLVLREIEGEQLEGKKDQLTLDDMRESLDIVTDDASDSVASALQH